MSQNKAISIVTATYNAANCLPNLINSLYKQTDKHFQWVVADGASNDGSLDLLAAVEGINVLVLSQPDFGIYDALNRAIKAASGDYYIVCGADDVFEADAIANFRDAIDRTQADIVTANVRYGKNTCSPKNTMSWLWGHRTYIAAHTLATAFKKDLHQRFGFYSRKYPIAADQLFVMQACQSGAKRINADFVAGEIGNEGVSSVDRVGNATEVFRVQLFLGQSKYLQTLILLLRLLKS
jgi:glycosyltransferase involved in cell wall biosynthesis